MPCIWHVRYFFTNRSSYDIDILILDRGVQMPGYIDHLTGKFIYMEEMEPELVVPDLTDFKVERDLVLSFFLNDFCDL